MLPLSIAGCYALPSNDGRSASVAEDTTHSTQLGRSIDPQLAAHPGVSGFHALANAGDAFAARMRMVLAAERSLDLQYYIWRLDLTGTLLFDALRQAADRGVRVRLLLDGHNTAGLDKVLAALDSHPHIEVRLFNPYASRSGRALQFLSDFSRLSRRMCRRRLNSDPVPIEF